MKILQVKDFFNKEGIHLTTIQPEFNTFFSELNGGNEKECLLDCPKSSRPCVHFTCCGQFQHPELFSFE